MKNIMKKNLIAIAAAALALFCSCEKEAEFVQSTGIKIEPATVTLLAGEVTELKATVEPEDATSKLFTWKSSNTNIATVDKFGRVSAIAPGEATITVTSASSKLSATCTVKVNPVPDTKISLDKSEITVYFDETESLTATIEPDNATYKNVTWTSSDETVATVSEEGVVYGVEVGKAVITATSPSGNTAQCKVTVTVRMPTEPEQVDIWKTDKAGYRGLYGAAADNGKTAGTDGWLKYEDGVATWTANTTGVPRQATLELSTASKITIMQIEGTDFRGEYNLYAKLFDPGKLIGAGNVNAKVTKVVFGEPLKGETLADDKGVKHTNNIGIKGLFFDSVMDACAEVDYDNKTVKFGIFFDRRSVIKASASVNMCYIPELSSGYWSGYDFAPTSFCNENYCWLWFTPVEGDMTNFKYQYYQAGQKFKTPSGDMYCCGISIVTGATLETLSASYNVIYQANYNGSNTESMYFKK